MSVIVSCGSDPKAANDRNFARAIDTYLEKDEKAGKMSLCMKNSATIPDEVPAGAEGAAKRATLDRYVQAGLALRQETTKPNPYSYTRHPLPPVHFTEYKLSPVGQSSIKTESVGYFGGHVNRICYGTFRVGKIVSFTEPADINGYRASHIAWLPRVNSVADWAKTDAGKALIGEEIASADKTEQASVAVLMGTGWEAGSQQ